MNNGRRRHPDLTKLRIEKRPGFDWRVWYVVHETSELQDMLVFGSPTIEDGLKEARYSLDSTDKDWYTIVQIELEPNI